jgi:hypothetical protein
LSGADLSGADLTGANLWYTDMPGVCGWLPGGTALSEFSMRTWKETSAGICKASGLPPGFHIALVDANGRCMRSDRLVLSEIGGFSGFEVWQFLEEVLKTCVKRSPSEEKRYCDAQLRDHKGNILDFDLQLRCVQEMKGLNGEYSERCYQEQELVDRICEHIRDDISLHEDEARETVIGDDKIIILRAIFQLIADDFDKEDVEYVAKLYLPGGDRHRHRPERRPLPGRRRTIRPTRR